MRLLSEHDRVLGSTIGLELAREHPGYNVKQDGFASLTHFLRALPDLAVVGRQGADYLWGLAEDANIDVEVGLPELSSVGAWSSPASQELWLDRFTAKNFKSLVDLDIPLRRFNVLVGANGAGKTSILQGLFVLSRLRANHPSAIFSPVINRALTQLRTAGREGPVELGMADHARAVSLTYVGDPRPDTLVPDHRVIARTPEWTGEYSFKTILADLPSLESLPIMQAFGGTSIMRLDSRMLAAGSPVNGEYPRLAPDGSGLPSLLADLAATDRNRLDQVIAMSRAIVPALDDVRMPRRNLGSNDLGHGLEIRIHGHWIDASLASEGTLLVLGLMTCLQGPASTRLILIEGIDHALHPTAQQTLLRQLRELPSASGLQIICTTHSPYLLDAVDPEDVLVVRASPETGHTRCRRLVEHDKWSRWKTSMTAGEFWSFAGEDWLEAE